MRVTSEMIHSNSTHPSGDGFTRKQLKVLGIEYPFPDGWLRRLASEEISDSAWESFVKISASEKIRMDAKRSGRPLPRVSDKQPDLFL